MRKQLLALSALAVALTAAPAFAEGKIGVVDAQAAIAGTDLYKKTNDSLEGQLKPLRDRMDAVQKELKALDNKFQKDGSVMSDKDKADLRKQAEAKFNEFQGLQQQGQKKAQEVMQDFNHRMVPKFETAVEDLRKAGGYEMILDRKAALAMDPAVDLTKKVTEKLNAAK